MATTNNIENNVHSLSLFTDCESAFSLIKEGKEKQAEQLFPLEYYLIQKYSYLDFNELSSLLAERLIING